MASPAIGVLDPAMNKQSDTADTPGNSIMNSLETTAVTVLNATTNAGVQAINGRMPYDPADPNFGSAVVQVRGVQGGLAMNNLFSGTTGLLLFGFVLWLIFRKKK